MQYAKVNKTKKQRGETDGQTEGGKRGADRQGRTRRDKFQEASERRTRDHHYKKNYAC